MNKKLISWVIFILLCFIWGSSFKLMKDSLNGLSVLQIASLRIFSASLVFLPFAFFHISKLPRRQLGMVVVIGLFGNLIPAFCFATAVVKIDSSLVGIINSLTPVCVVIIAVSFFKDKISIQKTLGVAIGFAGLCLLTFTQKNISLDNLGYALLIVAGTISYGINVNLVGHHLKQVNPIHLATVSLAFMSIPTGLLLWQQGFFALDFAQPGIRWAVVNASFLGVVASAFATVIFYILVQRAGGLFASLVTYGIPFVALFWGFTDGESITVVEIACLLIILLGVYLANRPEKTRTANP